MDMAHNHPATPDTLESSEDNAAPQNLQRNPGEDPEPGGAEREGLLSVAVYETNRSYGGPEEGGWWYDVGEPTENPTLGILTRFFLNKKEAFAYRDSLEPIVEEANRSEGRRDPGSVLCDGYYAVLLMDGYPRAYPEERPHYE